MFYVITRRTIITTMVWIALLILLAWAIFTFAIGGDRRTGSGEMALGQYAVNWVKNLFDQRPVSGGLITQSDLITSQPEDTESQSEAVDTKQEAATSQGTKPQITATTVTIGDAWSWNAADVEQESRPTSADGVEVVKSAAVTGGTLLRATSQPTVNIEPVEEIDRFSEFRLERDKSRSRQLEYLHGVINNPDLSLEKKNAAHEQLMAIMQRSESETSLENLLKASGLSETVVMISQDGVSVVVESVIDKEEAARIGSLVAKTAQVKAEDVRILDGDGL